jgi:hypothetical protein
LDLGNAASNWREEWITFDRDFARFPRLKWQVPAAGAQEQKN